LDAFLGLHRIDKKDKKQLSNSPKILDMTQTVATIVPPSNAGKGKDQSELQMMPSVKWHLRVIGSDLQQSRVGTSQPNEPAFQQSQHFPSRQRAPVLPPPLPPWRWSGMPRKQMSEMRSALVATRDAAIEALAGARVDPRSRPVE